jgi:hypothetical protein
VMASILHLAHNMDEDDTPGATASPLHQVVCLWVERGAPTKW